jgi:hypothetical protein
MSMELVKKNFIADVSKHSMKVLNDNGVYRHLEFSNNGSFDQKFSLVTYPHHLVFSGDMGTYVFSRVEDMFDFFHSDTLRINASYWAEKVEAVCRSDGLKTFDLDLVMKSINNRVEHICSEIDDYFEDYEDEEYETVEAFEAAFRAEVEEHFAYEDMDKFRYISVIEDFDSDVINNFEFADDFEWLDDEGYSERYLWCCHAIVWGIQAYNKLTKTPSSK